MPRLPKQYLDSESRSASIGIRNAFTSPPKPQSSAVKRIKRSCHTVGETYPGELVQTADLSSSIEVLSPHYTDTLSSDLETHDTNSMSDSSLGTNRLRSGFASERNAYRNASRTDTSGGKDNSRGDLAMTNDVYDLTTEDDDGGVILNVNGEPSDPIVISDDENAHSEQYGDNQSGTDTPIIEGIEGLSTRASQQGESGSVDLDHADANDTRGGRSRLSEKTFEPMVVDSVGQASTDTTMNGQAFIVDSTPATSLQTCLKDLSSDQLEDQFRYAFWYLDRPSIDLSRLARCLYCQEDGHVDEMCPRKICVHCNTDTDHESALCPRARRCERCRERGHDKSECKGMKNTTIPCDICSLPGHQEIACPLKYFPRIKDSSRTTKLWISCCICASRTHLVGDCPETIPEKAARWSLRSLDPSQVTNLSVQASVQNLEREAENRNMRPSGMKIKGRANIHHADANRRDQSDSDDQEFFGYPSTTRRPGRQAYRSRPDIRETRREAYRPNTRIDEYRPPRTGFYATDSFGQARSRSPGPFRHRDDRGRRSPSFDRSSMDVPYRPNRGHDTYRGEPSVRQPRNGAQNRVQGGVSIQMPTRKGNNNVAQHTAPRGTASLPARPPQNAAASDRAKADKEALTKKQRKKQKKRAQGQN